MNHLKVLSIGAVVALLVALGGVAPVFGVQVARADESCMPITASDISQITAVENDPTLSYSQEITQELALRRQLVGETIACAQEEVQTLQTALNNVQPTGGASQTLQSQYLGDLNDATNFYDLELTKLNGSGIASTEAIAREVLSWRTGTFDPLSENINNFILWAGNQSFFATAQTRMDQTQRAVAFIESASPDSELQNAFEAADSSFSTAVAENNAAESALGQSLSPDQTIGLIKQSLDSLSSTYQSFFTVSSLINAALPQQ
jgi:hypothetical protein